MIVLFSGTPGSGKSLHTSKIIVDTLKTEGGRVLANFEISEKGLKANSFILPVHFKHFVYVPNSDLTVDYLIDYSKNYFKNKKKIKEDSITLIIDECQLIFNAREWNKQGRDKWLSFFTQHRKYGYYIILIAQFDRMIDRQIRSLIEYEYIHRKVKNVGFGGFIFNLFSGGSLFGYVKRYYPLNERLGFTFFKGNNKLYNLYDSYSDFTG